MAEQSNWSGQHYSIEYTSIGTYFNGIM